MTAVIVRDVRFTADDFFYVPQVENLSSLVVVVRAGAVKDLAEAVEAAHTTGERLSSNSSVVVIVTSDEQFDAAYDVQRSIVGNVSIVRDGDDAFTDTVNRPTGTPDWVLLGDPAIVANVDAESLAHRADEADALVLRRPKAAQREQRARDAVLLVRTRTLGRLGWSITNSDLSLRTLGERLGQEQLRAAAFTVRDEGDLRRAHKPRSRRVRLAVSDVLHAEWWRSSDPAVQLRSGTHLVAALSLVLGVLATIWAHRSGDLLAFGDAQSHVNISKRVVSSLTPGLSQLGSVWLPLPHLLMVPFVIPDWLWRTGLAGAIVGVPSLALFAVNAYRLGALMTGSPRAALVVPVAILANPNVLYLSATPMTEVLLLAMVTTSLYYLARWVEAPTVRDLVVAALFAQLASLTRYDGWFLVLVEAVIVVGVIWWRTRSSKAVDGSTFLFGTVAFSGIALWLLWNLLIFSNPFYFATSEYSAKEQQRAFDEAGLFHTLHSPVKSVLFWLESVQLIVGPAVVAVGVVGLVLMVVTLVRRRDGGKLLIAGAAFSCFAFYIGSLYTGDALMMLPRFTDVDGEPMLYNVRYGVMAMVPMALLLAFVARHRQRVVVPALIVIAVASGVFMTATDNVWAYRDGIEGIGGAAARDADSREVERWMKDNYDEGLVVMDDFQRPIGQVESGIPMSAFIGSGTKPYWQDTLDDPGRHASWIVVRQTENDAVWSGFSDEAKDIVDEYFEEVFVAGDIHVFHGGAANR